MSRSSSGGSKAGRGQKMRTFHVVSLGCPKNTVDSQRILGALAESGWAYAEDARAAEVCLVNTCGFLRASCEEAARTLAKLRREAPQAKIVALGCLAERAGDGAEMAGFLKAADAVVGFADYARLPEICLALADGEAGKDGAESCEITVKTEEKSTISAATGYRGRTLPKSYMEWLGGASWRYGGQSTGWLKLGEGCSNHCAYCAIPLIRGDRVSRPLKEIVRNARELLDDGARELNLVAQDTTAYGMDFAGESRFVELLRAILKIRDSFFVRVLYAHPRHLTEEMLRVMADDERVCPYLDLPIQHSETKVLRTMRRGYDGLRVRELVGQIREILPEVALRTTVIVGHPGETEEEFGRLLEFVREGHFDHLGAFAWSPEPGTDSVRSRAAVATPEEARRRQQAVMAAQKSVSAARWRARRGTETVVFPDEERSDGTWACHSLYQAPDGLDGTCTLKIPADLAYRFDPGLPAVAKIVSTGAYSVRAELSPL